LREGGRTGFVWRETILKGRSEGERTSKVIINSMCIFKEGNKKEYIEGY
jgi:hypothetical protein